MSGTGLCVLRGVGELSNLPVAAQCNVEQFEMRGVAATSPELGLRFPVVGYFI